MASGSNWSHATSAENWHHHFPGIKAVMNQETVIVEFLGVPRIRAKVSEAAVPCGTLGEVLRHLQQQFPGLRDLLITEGALAPWYRVAFAQGLFVADMGTQITAGSRLLLMSTDVGG